MKISILLPFKENYSKDIAGAVSLFVNDTSKISKFRKSITIFGSTYSKKFLSKNYVNLTLKKNFLMEYLFAHQHHFTLNRLLSLEKKLKIFLLKNL